MVGNPFILDYLVAARGYGLASAFLLWALVLPAHWLREIHIGERRALASCMWCSTLAALSIASNVAFAVVAVMVVIVTMVWTGNSLVLSVGRRERRGVLLRLLLACTLPGLAVSLLFTANAVYHWPAGQLWRGASSLRDMVRTVAESSLYQPNPYLLSPPVHLVMEAIRPLLLPLLGIIVIAKLALLVRERDLPRDADSRVRRRVASIMAIALSLTILIHWFAFRWFHVLLPQERPALYIAVLSMGVTGLIAAEPLQTRLGHIVQRVFAATLVIAALYFLSCLRLTYFNSRSGPGTPTRTGHTRYWHITTTSMAGGMWQAVDTMPRS